MWSLSTGLALLAVLTSPGSEPPVSYYVAGQLHPLVAVTIELNGAELDTFQSTSGRPKIFIKQFDASLLKAGLNEMVIHWQVLEGEADPHPLARSGYRIALKHQKDPADRKTAVDLVKVGGVEVPLPSAGTRGSDRIEFQTLVDPRAAACCRLSGVSVE